MEKLDVGSAIRTIRELNGYSQQGLADCIGVSQKTISRIENNLTSPSILLVLKIAEEFQIDLDALLRTEKKEILEVIRLNGLNTPVKEEKVGYEVFMARKLIHDREKYIRKLKKELKKLKKKKRIEP